MRTQKCHCERSEAIYEVATLLCLRRVARNDNEVVMRNQKGSVFLFSVFIMVILFVLSFSFASMCVSQTRLSSNLVAATESLDYARAGLDKAIWSTESQPNTWRTLFTSGVWWTGAPLNNGTFEVTGIDTDGVLNDDVTDDVYFTARGYSGNAVRGISGQARPRGGVGGKNGGVS